MKCPKCGSSLLDDIGTFKCVTCEKKNGKLKLSVGKIESDEMTKKVTIKPGEVIEIYVKKADGSVAYLLKSNVPTIAWKDGPLTDRVDYVIKLKAILTVQ